MRRLGVLSLCVGLSISGALAACSGDPDSPPAAGDAGSDAPVVTERDARADDGHDAHVDPPTRDAAADARGTEDASPEDASHDAAADANGGGDHDAAADANGGGDHDAAADAKPSGEDAATDAGSTDASPLDASADAPRDAPIDAATGLVITSPATIPRTHSDPPSGSCTAATLGQFGIFDRVVFENGALVTAPDAMTCELDDFPAPGSYKWDTFNDVRQTTSYAQTPIAATWAGFVSFRQNGGYVGTLSVALFEADTTFVAECHYKKSLSSRSGYARGGADASEIAICESGLSESFGTPRVHLIGGAPTGAFYPASGGAPIPMTFIKL